MSGALNGPHVGVIISAGLLYTVLDTPDGPLNIPNSSLLASAVGPSSMKPEEAETDSSGGTPSDAVAPTQDGAVLATVVAGAESGLSARADAGHGDRKHPDT
jgi:hypothetical protein